MDGSVSTWKCWRISIPLSAVKRLQFLYSKLQEVVIKFRGEARTVSKELGKHLKRFYQIENPPELFLFFTKNTPEQDVRDFLHEAGIMKESTDHVNTGKRSIMCKLRDRISSGIPYVVIVVTSDADITTRQVMPHCWLDLVPGNKAQIIQESIIILNSDLRSPSEFRNSTDKILGIETLLDDGQKPRGSTIFSRDDKMIKDMISNKIEIILQKSLKILIDLIDEVNDVPTPMLEQGVKIVVILNEPALKSRARECLPQRLQMKNYRSDIRRRQIIWELVQYVRDDIFSNNKEKLGYLLSSQSEAKGIKTSLHSSLKEHFQCFIEGMINGVVLMTSFASSRNFHNDSQLSSGVIELLRILHDLLPFISSEIQNELNQKAGQIHQLQKMLNDWKRYLEHCLERCSTHYDVPLEVQIGLSRVHGVKSFGHWGGTFHVGIDASLNRDEYTERLQGAVGKYVRIDANMIEEYRKPVFHYKPGDRVNQPDSRNGMITMFVMNENERISRNLYFLTCKHVVPHHRQPVYIKQCRNCPSPCTCPAKEFGLSVYSFGPEQESIFEGLVDISCVKVHDEHVPLCDMNIRGLDKKLSNVQHFKGTVEDNFGKAVFKWGNTDMKRGTYDGVLYIDPNEYIAATGCQVQDANNGSGQRVKYRKIDLIRSEDEFGKPGESGALICIQEDRPGHSAIISTAFVYLGKYNNLYMSFRLQEGIDCLYNEHRIHLQQCTSNTCTRPRIFPQNCRKRRLDEDTILTS